MLELWDVYPDDRTAEVSGRAGIPGSGDIDWPEGIEPLFLPPRSQWLNPIERWFEELPWDLSNRVFE